MSRTWSRVTLVRSCGSCGRELAVGDPVLEIHLVDLRDPKLRCAICEGPPPPDLAPYVPADRDVDTRPMVKLRNVVVPFDFKRASAGDEE